MHRRKGRWKQQNTKISLDISQKSVSSKFILLYFFIKVQTCPPQCGILMLTRSPHWGGQVCTHFISVANWLKLKRKKCWNWQHWLSSLVVVKSYFFRTNLCLSVTEICQREFAFATSFTLPLSNSFSFFDPKVSSFWCYIFLHIFFFPFFFFLIRKDKRESNFHSLETMCCLFSGRTCWWLVLVFRVSRLVLSQVGISWLTSSRFTMNYL